MADVEASKSEGEDGEESEEQDLHDQFDDIYDDHYESGKSALPTSSSDSPVQPV